MKKLSSDSLRAGLVALALLAAVLVAPAGTAADERKDTLRVVSTFGINGLDYGNPTRTLWVMVVTWNVYDRLISFETKEVAPGFFVDDLTAPKGDLARELGDLGRQEDHYLPSPEGRDLP